MINKLLLQSIISKYYLNGLIESVKWDITDNELNVSFVSPTKDMVGKLSHTQFPLDNMMLAIFNTTQLNKLISITMGDILLELPTPNKLHISDSSFDVEYSLADPIIIPKEVGIKEPDKYEVQIKLSNEDIDNLVKAKNSLPDEELVTIKTTSNKIDFVFGDNSSHSNKVKYSIEGDSKLEHKKTIPFNASIFKDILVANKNPDTAKIFISERGLMKMEFSVLNTKTQYFLVRKSDN